MKWIKSYKKYKESLLINIELSGSDVMESLNMLEDLLLNAINAEEVDIFDTLEFPKNNLDIDYLFNSADFLDSLTKRSLKKSQLEDTKTYQTFLKKPCKFVLIVANPFIKFSQYNI